MPDPEPLAALAAKAAADPFFLGWTVNRFQEQNRLSDAALAALLGIDPSVLPSLRLCRRPGAAGGAAAEDVRLIAARFGIDPAALGRVLAGAAAPPPPHEPEPRPRRRTGPYVHKRPRP
jgi:hypothetical protein